MPGVPSPGSGAGGSGPQRADAAGFGRDLAGLTLSVQREYTDYPGTLAAVTRAAATIIPGATCAAIIGPAGAGEIGVRAAYGNLPQAVAELRNEIGQGLYPDASDQAAEILIPDTRADGRPPAFGERAAAIGAASMICTPLAAGTASAEFLLLISRTARAFNDESMRLAAALAMHAAIALAAAESRRQLDGALSTRDMIGQAKGILMERHQMTAGTAFLVLAQVSQDTNTKLRDVASELSRTGALRRSDTPAQLR